MSTDLQNLAWHRTLGKLIEHLDIPDFWCSLVRILNTHVQVDNWVVLIFSNSGVELICCRETIDDVEKSALEIDYLKGLYTLDPFYISNREKPLSGLFHLLDISPTHFHETEYYKTYFRHYVSVDEVQFNAQLDDDRTLCLSLGSKKNFSQLQIALLEIIQPWVIALMRQRMNFEHYVEKPMPHTLKWQDARKKFGSLLTVRELEVLKLLLSGFSNRQISVKLSISVDTVKAHRRSFYKKLNIKSQTELFAVFFQKIQTNG